MKELNMSEADAEEAADRNAATLAMDMTKMPLKNTKNNRRGNFTIRKRIKEFGDRWQEKKRFKR